MNKGLTAGLIAIIILLIASVGYFIYQNQKILKDLSGQKQSQQTPQATTQVSSKPAPSPTPLPSPSFTLLGTQSAIKSHLNSKDYKGLIPYMTSPAVDFSLMSTECCPEQSQQEAATQMSYIENGLPLDFDQNNPQIKTLKDKNAQLKNTFIGISTAGEHLAAFTINSENKISKIQLSVSWKLYNN